MFAFEVEPVFRGATYVDSLQMVDANDGSTITLDPSDYLVWRLFSVDRRYGFGMGYGWGGCDYEFASGPGIAGYLNNTAIITLSSGNGLFTGTDGTIQWQLTEGQTLCLHRPEYRMTLDLTRYGQTARILDSILSAMD